MPGSNKHGSQTIFQMMNLPVFFQQLWSPSFVSSKTGWRVWFGLLLSALCLHLTSFFFSPNIWVDEVQITEYGRITLHPQSDWSIVWQTAVRHPLPPVTYLGCLFQELAFLLTGSALGPRFFSLLGALAAATLAFGWLRARGNSPLVAWVLGTLFFLDPYFMVSYRFGRVDSWSLAIFFGLAWLVRHRLKSRAEQKPVPAWLAGLIGAGAVGNFFVWPTSFILTPLLLAELLDGLQAAGRGWGDRRNQLKLVAGLALGAVGSLVGCLLPMAIQHVGDLGQAVQVQANGDYLCYADWSVRRMEQNTASFYSFSRYCWLFPLCLGSVFWSRGKWAHWLVFLLALVAVSISRVYLFRLVYLLPFLVVLGAHFFQWVGDRAQGSLWWQRFGTALTALLLAWTTGFAFLSWVVAPSFYQNQTDDRVLYQTGSQLIGQGPKKVFLDNFALSYYYVGRRLGWHMYSPDTSFSGGKPFALDLQALLPEMEYAIIYEHNTYLQSQLEKGGFHREAKVGWDEPAARFPVELALEIYPYGPYLLYVRPAKPSLFNIGQAQSKNRSSFKQP